MEDLKYVLESTFFDECNIPDDVESVFINDESAVATYKTSRDYAVFTNKRLIIMDTQGFTGKKVEIYSLPYSSINMWSTENASGLLDADGELELWTVVGPMKIKFNKDIDIRKIDRIISEAVL